MNARHHYDTAEWLIDHAEGLTDPTDVANHLAAAQVHATLALTAITAADRTLGPVESWGGRVYGIKNWESDGAG